MKEKLKIHLQQKPYFLLLLPFFFILHGYNAFFGHFPLKFVLFNFIVTATASITVYLLSWWAFKNKRKASVFSFWLLLYVLAFGFLHDSLKRINYINFISSYKFILPFTVISFLIFGIILRKRKLVLQRSFTFLNVLLFVFFGFEIVTGIVNYSDYINKRHLIDNRFSVYKNIPSESSVNNQQYPDIYYIVFDAFPSSQAMKSTWGYDNSRLDSFLHSQEFYVASNSKSNYNLTVLSISSTLNMDYMPTIDLYQDETKMYFKASASILDNSLTRFLQDKEYNIKHYQPVSFNNKDWNGGLLFPHMLYMNYFYQTLPGRLYRDIGWNVTNFRTTINRNVELSKYAQRNRDLNKDLLNTKLLIEESLSKNKQKPQFVYAHFLLPHDPYIYDSTGQLKPAEQTILLKEQDQPDAFIEQVKYTNKIIRQLVSSIKQKNKSNTIIIISGDHGFRNAFGTKHYMTFDNFSAYYFPNKQYKELYPSISPVNSFRVVLNNFFNTNLSLMKDSSIFIPYTLPGETE